MSYPRLSSRLLTILCLFSFTCSVMAQNPSPQHPELAPIWLKISIHAQNAAHRINDLGADTGPPDPKAFHKEIKAIDSLLDELVAKGELKTHHFKLKPELDIEDSLIQAVIKFMNKAAEQYGYFVVREMMDLGTRQRIKPFDETVSVVLNVRMPEKLLKEFIQLLHKNGFKG